MPTIFPFRLSLGQPCVSLAMAPTFPCGLTNGLGAKGSWSPSQHYSLSLKLNFARWHLSSKEGTGKSNHIQTFLLRPQGSLRHWWSCSTALSHMKLKLAFGHWPNLPRDSMISSSLPRLATCLVSYDTSLRRGFFMDGPERARVFETAARMLSELADLVKLWSSREEDRHAMMSWVDSLR